MMIDVAERVGEDTVDFVKKHSRRIIKFAGRAAAPACYINKAVATRIVV
jgi:hypothetical protein